MQYWTEVTNHEEIVDSIKRLRASIEQQTKCFGERELAIHTGLLKLQCDSEK
jgi:hypothetical protein